MEGTDTTAASPAIAAGEKAKARDILAAVKTLQTIEREHRPATHDERDILLPMYRTYLARALTMNRTYHYR